MVAVIGWPLEESESPAWHTARLSGRSPAYRALPLRPPLCPRALRRVMAGLVAANVTSPHKEAAWRAAGRATAAAHRCRAANLLWWRGGELVAANTDLPAFARVACSLGVRPGDGWLVLGTGGAGRAAAAALADAGCRPRLVGRRPGPRPGGMVAVGYPEARAMARRAAGVVNATPVDDPGLDPALLAPGAWALDLSYQPQTPFLEAAGAAGLRTRDGRAMFVAQARLAARAWGA